MSNADPRTIILQFLEEMPTTIKAGLISSIASLYSGNPSTGSVQAEAIIVSALQPKDALTESRAVVFLCASIDHVLCQGERNAEKGSAFLKMVAQATGSKGLEAAVLGEPLRAKHAQQVREAWVHLRTDQLSHQRLVDYEYSLVVRDIKSAK